MSVFLYVCMCITYMPGAQEPQKRLLYPLDPELQLVVNQYMGAGS